jgi:hypothetical protein
MKLMTGTSFIAMTAAERAKGRYMRAPDHPTGGGEGGDGGGEGGDGGDTGGEPTGGEINDPIEDRGTPGDRREPASAEDDSSADGDGDGEEGDGKPPPKSVEERIGELTAAEREAKRQLAERDRDLEYWRGRAEGTINEDGSPVNPPEDERTIPGDDPDRPNPEDYQYGETDAAFIRDLARYEARAAYAEERQNAQVQEQLQDVENKHSERVTTAKERYADYDEVVVKGADVDPATGEAKWACSPLMALGIKTSDFGPDIAYDLATNPEESVRIAKLSPLEQAKEFGRLEYKAELAAKADGRLSGEAAPTKKVTNAPEPPPRARGAGGNFEAADDTDDFEAFEQKVDAKQKGKKRLR